MAEDKLLDDFDENIRKIDEVMTFLDKLYYDPEFSSLFNRPAISMLISGCQFLITNLSGFRKQREEALK